MTVDETYMQRCLDLAIKGLGNVAPNPMVGCVIVHEGKIIGEGFHQQYGQAHAEVNAVNSVQPELKHLLSSSTLYVNLEPCSHFGKTPPCADMIIANKIPHVVIGSNDPNPKVSGNGIKKLKDAGVEVISGVLKTESDFLNRCFITYHTKHRPYIILKWAQSDDGFMSPAEPKQLWLTNDSSRKLTHQWRSEEQAIMVGKRTVEIDNPALTVRLVKGKNPVRLVIDRELSLKITNRIFKEKGQLFLYNEIDHSDDEKLSLVQLNFEQDVLPQIMEHLFAKEIQSLIVEGGLYTLQQFIDSNLWDEARIFTTAHILGEGKKSPELNGKIISDEMIEGDKLRVMMNERINSN